jgi:CubicO group peptidase (beta-lactamase class C family)
MVVKDRDIIFQRTRGIADVNSGATITPQSNFRLASVTKHMTALSVLMLSDWGDLNLDAPLTDYFPGFPAFGASITPRMLIHHTSGLIDYESIMGADEFAPLSKDRPQKQVVDADVLELIKETDHTYFTPGSEFRYSNTGYALLALLVENASGLSFPQFLKKNIFQPLGMYKTLAYAHDEIEVPHRVYGHSRTESSWELTDQSATSAVLGDGGVYSSLSELRKWFEFLDGKNTLNLSEKAYREYFSAGMFNDGSKVGKWNTTAENPGKQIDIKNYNYGYGWFIGKHNDTPLYFHGGGSVGFKHFLVRKPVKNLYAVVLTNRNEINRDFIDSLFSYALEIEK